MKFTLLALLPVTALGFDYKNPTFLNHPFVTGNNKENAGRNLEDVLECGDKKLYDFDAYIESTSSNVNSQGSKLTQQLRDIRGGTDDFYNDTLAYLLAYRCEDQIEDAATPADSPATRCVAEGDGAKNFDDNCIVASDSVCPVGKCERLSNCYWKPVEWGMPRERRYTDEVGAFAEEYIFGKPVGGEYNAQGAVQDQDSYIFGLVKYLAFGIVGAVVWLVLWTSFFVFRWCCCCLADTCLCRKCSTHPKDDGYNVCRQVKLPSILYVLFVAGVGSALAFSFVGNEDITKGLDDWVLHADGLLNNSKIFMDGVAGSSLRVEDLIETSVVEANDVIDGTDFVATQMAAVSASVINFADLYSAGITEAGADADVDAITTQLTDEVQVIVDSVTELLDTLQNELVDSKDSIKSQLAEAREQTDEISADIVTYRADLQDIKAEQDEFTDIRQIAVLAIFAVALVFVLLGLFGVFSSNIPCCKAFINLLHCTTFFGAIVVTLSLILAGLFTFLSVFWSDGCEFLSIVTLDFEPYIGEEVSTSANACFNGQTLSDALNLTSQVDFQEQIDAQLEDMKSFKISESFEAVEDPLNELVIKIDAIDVQPLVDVLNELTDQTDTALVTACPWADTYTLASAQEPWNVSPGVSKTGNTAYNTVLGAPAPLARILSETPAEYGARIYSKVGVCGPGADCVITSGNDCTSGDDCEFQCAQITTGITTAFEQTIEKIELKANMKNDLGFCGVSPCTPTPEFKLKNVGDYEDFTINDNLADYQVELQQVVYNLLNITDDAIGSILLEVEILLCNIDCNFVGDAYNGVYTDVCETLLGGTLQISTAFWLLSLFLFIEVVLAAVLAVRLKGISRDEADIDAEMEDLYG